MEIRPMLAADLPAVLALNQGALDGVGPLDGDRLEWITSLDGRALLADDNGIVAGFVITIGPGTPYDSINYRWFEERYDDHTYLDRVVIAPDYRRTGLGSRLYDAIESDSSGPVTLEVYVVPPNDVSLAFHRSRGYDEVGRLEQSNGKVAALFAR